MVGCSTTYYGKIGMYSYVRTCMYILYYGIVDSNGSTSSTHNLTQFHPSSNKTLPTKRGSPILTLCSFGDRRSSSSLGLPAVRTSSNVFLALSSVLLKGSLNIAGNILPESARSRRFIGQLVSHDVYIACIRTSTTAWEGRENKLTRVIFCPHYGCIVA